MALAPLTAAQIEDRLNHFLEVEFTFHHTDQLAAELARLPREEQQFALDWVRRIATTHVTLAHEFARRAPGLMGRMDPRVIEAWAVQLCDSYDRLGLYPALRFVENADGFMQSRHANAADVLFEDVAERAGVRTLGWRAGDGVVRGPRLGSSDAPPSGWSAAGASEERTG